MMNKLNDLYYINKLKSFRYSFLSVPEEHRTPAVCLAAVRRDGLSIAHVNNQTAEICLAAVKQNGFAIADAKFQTDEICLAAVKQNGMSLEYIKIQTEEMCLAAVKQNGLALLYCDFHSTEIYATALNHCPEAIVAVDPDVYEYNAEQIEAAYNKTHHVFLDNEGLKRLLSIIAKIMSRLDNDMLVSENTIKLLNIFTDDDLNLSPDLNNIKSKASMLSSVSVAHGLDLSKINIIDKKPKII